jgi:hypothetical protein
MDSTVVQIAAHQLPSEIEQVLAGKLRALRPLFDGARLALARIVEALPGVDDFARRELLILAVANEIVRQLFEVDLQRIADFFPDEVKVKGERYRRHARGTVTYHTLCGDVSVRRDVYRLIGVHNGKTIVPLEVVTGLFMRATPALGFSVAQGVADMPPRLYQETMRAAGRRPPSRSTISRLAKGAGGAMKHDVEVIEAAARGLEQLPPEAHAISVGLDRTTVPMAEEVPLKAKPRKRPAEDYRRKPPQPVEVHYRMAYVGTVSVVDPDGKALRTWRYGATAEEGPDEIVRRMMEQVRHLQSLKKHWPVAIVQDGAPELWGLMWQGLRSIAIEKWTNILDCWHVKEHMNAALDLAGWVVYRGTTRDRYINGVERSDRKVGAFARWLWKNCRETRKWNEIAPHYNYLESAHACRHTRYATARKLGLPTGSGVTEGACKSLITMRFKRSGQRWQQDGLSAVLTLRAFRLSDRLPTAWGVLRNRFTAIVEC